MIDAAPTIDSVLPHLESALANPSIPARAHIAGTQLLERLTSPIRVVITGHPGSGKSQLLNLLAGERVVPDHSALPTLELRYGETPRLIVTNADGTSDTRGIEDLAMIDRRTAALVTLESPLPILRTLALTEVVGGETAEEERASLLRAAERADIVLWCSQEFTPAEQWLWSALPERLKDHGYLVLTKADRLLRDGTLSERIADLEDIVAEEFHSLVPIATLQGLAALLADGGADKAALAASGATALKEALLRHVEQGRRADLDAALMFLSRFGGGSATAPAPAPAPQREPAETQSEAESEVEVTPVPAPETTGTIESAPETPAPVTTLMPKVSANADGERDETGTPVGDAIAILIECGRELGESETAATDPGQVLARCAGSAQAAADALESAGDDLLAPSVATALDVADRLVLIQLEGSEEAAADAVTLLLQLRRELVLGAAA